MIRLGVIGYGRRLRRVLDAVSAVDPEATVVAVVDPLGDALRRSYSERLRYATFFGSVDRLLDEGRVDGVLIGTRCSLHAQLAIKVLERDLPLFLEKPVAIEWEQLRALQAASERSRSPVVVSFPLRVSPLCEAVRGIVDAGAIGTIEQVQAVNNVPPYAATYYHGWMRDESETGGLWLQKATHDFDYITSLVRQQPVQICAVESKTVFRGEMPAGLCCADCELQRDCPESP
jgi:predicted dehydrogenase